MQRIDTISDYRKAIRQGPYMWPGGYALVAIMADGEVLCWDAFKAERRPILQALRDKQYRPRDGWLPVVLDAHWEGPPMVCSHTGKEIPSEYGDPFAQEDA